MAMLENFASLEEKILCLNYPISKLDGVYDEERFCCTTQLLDFAAICSKK